MPTSSLVVPQLSGNSPSNIIPKDVIEALPKIPLADPFFHKCSQVDILLGGDVFPSIVMTGQMNNVCGSLLAQETIFGWILTGPFSSATSTSSNTKVAFHCSVSLEEEIFKFWVVEDLPSKNFVSNSDQFYEEFFLKSTSRNESGQFIV